VNNDCRCCHNDCCRRCYSVCPYRHSVCFCHRVCPYRHSVCRSCHSWLHIQGPVPWLRLLHIDPILWLRLLPESGF
jgi:hypothetical protein